MTPTVDAVSADAPPPSLAAHLVDAAASRYQPAGRFAWTFARAKLSRDPLFATLLRTGAVPTAACLVDLGCGQGLLACWIHAAHAAWSSPQTSGSWPSAWPAPPKVGTYLGIDQSAREIARAKAAMPPFARVFRGDIRTVGMAMLDRCDVATIFDVLQYLSHDEQERLLATIAERLPPWGVLVLRIGDGAATFASRWANGVDLVVCAFRGHPRWRLHRRSVDAWRELLERKGFVVEVLDDGRSTAAASQRRSFANVLLRASRPGPLR